jgi:hypothetical protein
MPQRNRVVGGTVLITAIPTMDGITAGITIGIGTTGIGRITANQQARFRLAFGRASLVPPRPIAYRGSHLLGLAVCKWLARTVLRNSVPAATG